MGKYNNEKNNPNLIKKIASGRSLCSFIGPKVGFENVVLEFVEYDSNTYKKTKEIDIYFPIDEILGFCQLVIDRTVLKGIKADLASMQQRGLKYSDNRTLFYRRGGGDEEVRNDSNNTKIKKCKFREFYIQASSNPKIKNGLVLVAEKCDGYKDEKGLINPMKGYPNKEKVIVPLGYETLFNTASLIQARITAFLTFCQMSGVYERAQETNTEAVAEQVADNTYIPQEALNEAHTNAEVYLQTVYEPINGQPQGGVQAIDPEQAFFDAHNAQYS